MSGFDLNAALFGLLAACAIGVATWIVSVIKRDVSIVDSLWSVLIVTAAGTYAFALQAAGFIAAPVAGHMSDKMGRRNVIMSSMVMTGVVLFFMVFADAQTPAFPWENARCAPAARSRGSRVCRLAAEVRQAHVANLSLSGFEHSLSRRLVRGQGGVFPGKTSTWRCAANMARPLQ